MASCDDNDDDDEKANEREPSYNDDAFGLVFLTTLLVLNDRLFATVFAVASFFSVIAVRQSYNKQVVVLPGVTAFAALAITTIIRYCTNIVAVVDDDSIIDNISSLHYELVLCCVSLGWCLVSPSLQQSRKGNKDDDSSS